MNRIIKIKYLKREIGEDIFASDLTELYAKLNASEYFERERMKLRTVEMILSPNAKGVRYLHKSFVERGAGY